MRRARRGNAANAAIAHAEKHARRLVRTRRLPHFSHDERAKASVAISLCLHSPAQQRPVVVRFCLSVPIDAGDVTLIRKPLISKTRAPLVHALHATTTPNGGQTH